MTLGVVIPCYRQERFLPRTLAALERSLSGLEWRGALVVASPDHAPLPALGAHWQVIAPPVATPLTPGAARMLGFAACGGEWVLFVDADVEVDETWCRAALALAAEGPALAGLGGRLEEWFVDRGGERQGSPDMYRVGGSERRVSYLATLALYRRGALLAAGGYDARLRSEEDFELGMRFGFLGLELRSLAMRAARHWSAPRPSFGEIARRWHSGLCLGMGQVLRLYLGRPGFGTLLRRQAHYLAMLALWTLGLAAGVAWAATGSQGPFAMWALLPSSVFVLMTTKKRSPRLALHSMLVWSVNAAGLVLGFVPAPGGAPLEGRRAC